MKHLPLGSAGLQGGFKNPRSEELRRRMSGVICGTKDGRISWSGIGRISGDKDREVERDQGQGG